MKGFHLTGKCVTTEVLRKDKTVKNQHSVCGRAENPQVRGRQCVSVSVHMWKPVVILSVVPQDHLLF